MSNKRDHKGIFSDVRLPVSRSYVYPTRRRKMILVGIAAAVLLLAFTLLDFQFGRAGFVQSGPLSSAHSALEQDCMACHDGFGSVRSENCSSCHERFAAEHGTYTFAAHYLYHSDKTARLTKADLEMACVACHVEHSGRGAPISRVDDSRCVGCHAFGSFSAGHPEFMASGADDDAGLHFPHTLHLQLLRDEGMLSDDAPIETGCLICHRPRDGARGFLPLSFETQCAPCHLAAGTGTAYVEIWKGNQPGVESLQSLQQRFSAGSIWDSMGERTFQERGGKLRKRRLEHPDPWVLENLERLRSQAGLHDWLATMASRTKDLSLEERTAMYDEAIRRLEHLAASLSGRMQHDIQRKRATGLAAQLAKVRDDGKALDAASFPRIPFAAANQLDAIRAVATKMSTPCRLCHVLDDLTIMPVQKDQRVLRRAEFDHQAHILVSRCLDCHDKIPFEAGEQADPELDVAATQNIPAIDNCRECHTPASGTGGCVTCHYFHPDKDHGAGLLVTREVAP